MVRSFVRFFFSLVVKNHKLVRCTHSFVCDSSQPWIKIVWSHQPWSNLYIYHTSWKNSTKNHFICDNKLKNDRFLCHYYCHYCTVNELENGLCCYYWWKATITNMSVWCLMRLNWPVENYRGGINREPTIT